jgi:hypothetical protein
MGVWNPVGAVDAKQNAGWHSRCYIDARMQMLSNLSMLAAIVWGIALWMKGPTLQTAPGVVVEDEPVQATCPAHVVANVKDYTITAVATYTIRARVLHTKHYWADGNDIVPFDVALGWGRMSDQSIIDKFRISQGNRFFFYEYDGSPVIPESEIVCHSSNNHLIAADSHIAHAIAGLYPGEIVTMQGYLVNVSNAKGLVWNSSLTRTDTGNGACEVMYVQGIKAERPAEK